jgi:hypothetical protein
MTKLVNTTVADGTRTVDEGELKGLRVYTRTDVMAVLALKHQEQLGGMKAAGNLVPVAYTIMENKAKREQPMVLYGADAVDAYKVKRDTRAGAAGTQRFEIRIDPNMLSNALDQLIFSEWAAASDALTALVEALRHAKNRTARAKLSKGETTPE